MLFLSLADTISFQLDLIQAQALLMCFLACEGIIGYTFVTLLG